MLQVNKTKAEVIAKLPPLILVERAESFLGHLDSIEDS